MAVCVSGKLGHKSAAKAAKHRQGLRRISTGEPLTIYRCAQCDQWHVGRERRDARNPLVERRARR